MPEQLPATMADADAALTTSAPEEPEVAAAEPAAEPEGQPRDEQGRFTETPKDEPEPSPEEPAESPEPLGEPTEPVEATPDAESEPEPFVYRADGQEFEIPGSAVGDEGIFIPSEHLQEVQQLLSAGRASFGSVRQRLSESAAREQQAADRAAAAEAQAQTILAHFESLIEKNQIGEWLQNVAQNWPILKAESKAKAVELATQAQTQELARYREQEQQTALRPLMDSTLQDSIRQQGAQAGLDDDTLGQVYRELQSPDYQGLLFVKAPYDDPASGIRKGELVIDHGVVAKVLRFAGMNRARPAQQQKIAEAVKANAQVEPKGKKIPPTVGGRGRTPQQAVPAFTSAKDADEYLLHGDLDQFAED